MQKILGFVLASGRKRRRFTVGAVIWLLRLVRDAENDEMQRYSDMIDSFNSESYVGFRRGYNDAEEKYSACGYALGFIESAIEDLGFAY